MHVQFLCMQRACTGLLHGKWGEGSLDADSDGDGVLQDKPGGVDWYVSYRMGCIDADTRLEILGFFLEDFACKSKHKPQTPSNQHPSLENEYCTKLTAPAK